MKRRVLLAGGSGFLGKSLARTFITRGDEVVVLTRKPQNRSDGVKEMLWDARNAGDWVKWVDGADTVINLTGKSVDCRYTEINRRLIINSRVDSTRILGEVIANCEHPPRVWLNCSSATVYKHTFDTPKDETGQTGATAEAKDQFSIEVIRQWERALDDARTPHTRKVALRATIVLGREGGAFPVFHRLARLGLGGRMGSGKQYVSWIHEDDFCRAIEWIMEHDELSGPINVAAPNPLPNSEMMRLTREASGVPFGLPAPEWLLEIGAFFIRTETELIIKSRYVVPGRLPASGFGFQFPKLEGALADLVKAKRPEMDALNPIKAGAP